MERVTGQRVCPNPKCPDIELFGVQGEYSSPVCSCPKCGSTLVAVPTEEETHTNDVECSEANEVGERLVPFMAPVTSAELAIVESLLIAQGIPYFIHNRYFGSLKVGPDIQLLNRRTVFVPESRIEECQELLSVEGPEQAPQDLYSWSDRLRIFLESAFFVWNIPHPRPNRNRNRLTKSFQAARDPRERGPRPLNSHR